MLFTRNNIVYLGKFVYLLDKKAKWSKNTYWVTSNNNEEWPMKIVKCVMDSPLTLETLGGEPFFYESTGFWRIVATNDKSLGGVPKLPQFDKSEVDFQEWEKLIPNVLGRLLNDFALEHTYPVRGVLRNLYKAASKKYSKEDMYEMFQLGREFELSKDERDSLIGAEEAIEPLTPRIREIELETEYHYEDRNTGRKDVYDNDYPVTMSMWEDNKIPKDQQRKLKLDDKGFVIIRRIEYGSV